MEGYETKDYSPNESDYVYAVPGMREDVEMADKDGSIKDILKDWHPPLMSYFDYALKKTIDKYYKLAACLSNNRLKRHHIPMRRGER